MARPASLGAASTFIAQNARLLDRLRFAYHFQQGQRAAVIAALLAYQNPDGGFGNALEPDLRGEESEPVPAWSALGVLDEVGAVGGPPLTRLLHHLETIGDPRTGAVPFVRPTVKGTPHAPWWDPPAGSPRPALNPTAGIVGLLWKNRVKHRWLSRSSAWCWARIGRLRELNPYDLRVIFQFLDHAPDRARAEEALARLRPLILEGNALNLTRRATGEGFRPVDVSPEPSLRSRALFSPELIAANLDRIARLQKPDGGWQIDFPVWTPITRFEWRGHLTVEMLRLLRINGRL